MGHEQKNSSSANVTEAKLATLAPKEDPWKFTVALANKKDKQLFYEQLDQLGVRYEKNSIDGRGEKALSEKTFDIAVLDESRITGELGRWVKKVKESQKPLFTPVLTLVSESRKDEILTRYGEITDEFLTKPLKKETLNIRIKNLLDLRSLSEELASYPKRNPHPVIEWDRTLELKFANDPARGLLVKDCSEVGEEEKSSFQEFLPQIQGKLQSQAESRTKNGSKKEAQSLYKEFAWTQNGGERVYGFHFHYLPESEGIRAYGFDVTERQRTEKELINARKDLELLTKTNQLIIRTAKRSELLEQICQAITEVEDYPLVWVGRKEDDKKKRVKPVAHSGCEKGYLDDLDVRWSKDKYGQGPTGKAIRRNEPQVEENIPDENSPNYDPWREDAQQHGLSSSIALPIPCTDEEEIYGALNIYSRKGATFSDKRVQILEQLADDLGLGLQYIEIRNELEEMTIGTLEALSRTVEAKDEYTGEHINRVQQYALEVGEKLGLSQEELDQLGYASELHDIGKVRIPDSILGKPGDLTDKEWEVMERHPAIGKDIVGKVPRLKRAAKVIAQHQEKYDGTGYPEGLEGDEITLEARIIAVVDAWDAMRTDRPYRDALPKEVAIKELEENKGSQFDPGVVEEFLELIEN